MISKISLILRITVALILIQTLRFKFTAHPDSVYIFSTLNLEPYGRIFTGVIELIAGVLLIIPKTIWIGATITIGIISGAIFSHIALLGIEVNNDGGILFATAITTFILSTVILILHRKEIRICFTALKFR